MKYLNVDPTKLTKSQILRFCVYLIEKECVSYGEGIFSKSELSDDNNWDWDEIMKNIQIKH